MINFFNICKAIDNLCYGAKFYLHGDSLDDIEWLDKRYRPSNSLIKKEINRFVEEEENNKYKILRKNEYEKLNQFELLYDDKINNTNNWENAIKEIKERYPKNGID